MGKILEEINGGQVLLNQIMFFNHVDVGVYPRA